MEPFCSTRTSWADGSRSRLLGQPSIASTVSTRSEYRWASLYRQSGYYLNQHSPLSGYWGHLRNRQLWLRKLRGDECEVDQAHVQWSPVPGSLHLWPRSGGHGYDLVRCGWLLRRGQCQYSVVVFQCGLGYTAELRYFVQLCSPIRQGQAVW